ncbi:MAG: oxaloacetate-decarboxylating malate dehydrogenase, partial [Gaiellales bacterium]
LLRDQRVCIVGAGSAGTGIAEQLVRGMTADGLDEDEARRRIFMVDRHGLVHDAMTELLAIQTPLAQPFETVAGWASPGDSIDLLDVVTNAKPTVLIGVSGQPGIFTREIVSAMAGLVERPIILPLSNPTSRAEAAPADLLTWTKGRALVATGSPFESVRLDGVPHEIAQANNVYVFPGLGLGTIAVAASEVTDGMIMAAAGALAEISQRLATHEGSPLLPPLAEVRAVSEMIAVAVATRAVEEGVARSVPEDIAGEVRRRMWEPVYRPMVAR